METLILASASPRRREIIAGLGLRCDVCPAQEEPAVDGTLPLKDAVVRVARAKAQEVAARFPGRVVLGADTVVAVDGLVLGKPADAAGAAAMLQRLAGRTHTVVTGVWLCGLSGCLAQQGFASTAAVTFYPLSDADIAAYVATGEPLDKAGAYGIQGRGMRYVQELHGDFYTVMGLPAARVWRCLQETGTLARLDAQG